MDDFTRDMSWDDSGPWSENRRGEETDLNLPSDFWDLPHGKRREIWIKHSECRTKSGREEYERSYPPQNTISPSRYEMDDDDCFVATSAFEGRNHLTVEKLRAYRNKVLQDSFLGRAAIVAYYGGLGQTAARVLDTLPELKPLVRKGLDLLVANHVGPALQVRERIHGHYK